MTEGNPSGKNFVDTAKMSSCMRPSHGLLPVRTPRLACLAVNPLHDRHLSSTRTRLAPCDAATPQASRSSKTHRSPKTVSRSRPHKTAALRGMGRSWPLASWPRSRPGHCLGGTLTAIGSLRLSFVRFPIQCTFTLDLILS